MALSPGLCSSIRLRTSFVNSKEVILRSRIARAASEAEENTRVEGFNFYHTNRDLSESWDKNWDKEVNTMIARARLASE